MVKVMVNDPNWLYSTIAQSSAAIVAIIGGFITASVLSLTAEKRSLTNQKKDKETRLHTLRNEERILSVELDEKEVKDFLESITAKIIDGDVPSLEELIRDNTEAQSLNPTILKREYEVLADKVLKAKNFIMEHSEKINLKSGTFIDWVEMNNLDISIYDCEILERLYNNVQDQKQESLSEWEQATIPPSLLRMRLPYVTPISEQQELQRLRQKIQEDAGEIVVLENDVNSLDFRISKFSYPPNLGWAVVVLGFLAVFGILLPALIIANEAFFSWAKLLTLITFWIGLIGVFTYVVFQIRTLKK